MPWDGKIEFAISLSGEADSVEFELALRIPNWFQDGRAELKVNGVKQSYNVDNDYAQVDRSLLDGDTLEWLLPIETKLIAASPQIRADAGKAATQRGPFVYCVEDS